MVSMSGLRIALRGVVLSCAAVMAFGGSAASQTRGGTVTLGVEQDLAGFDPIVVGVYDTGPMAAAALLFDTLTRLDDNGVVQPRLALSWSSSPDFKKWTFKLRPGVKFHDGAPFNADAVSFNYDRMMDPANNCRCAFFLNGISNIDTPDDLTLVYHLRVPAVNFPALLSPPAVVNVFHSPKAIQELGEGYNHHPVGTGPFKLKSWQMGDRIVLERNPDYWNSGHPYLDEVVIRPLPDPGARFASLLAGDVDIIWNDVAEAIKRAMGMPSLRVSDYEGAGISTIVLNVKKPPLDDIRVRQALRYGADIQGLADAFAEGLYHPAKDPYGAGSFVKCKDTGTLPFDLPKAQALIKDYGKPVSLKMMVTAEPRGMGIGQIFQEFWKAAGITVTLDPVDQTTFVSRSLQHDFEIGAWRIADLADPEPQIYADFHTGSPVNTAQYSNPELDKLLEEARAMADRGQRIEDYCKIAEVLNKDVPWIWLFSNHYFNIAKAELRGVHKQYSDTIDVADAWWEKKK